MIKWYILIEYCDTEIFFFQYCTDLKVEWLMCLLNPVVLYFAANHLQIIIYGAVSQPMAALFDYQLY